MTKDEGAPERLIERRKNDHIDICVNEDLSQHYAYWDDVKLIHNPLPEIDLEEIDTSTTLFGRPLKAPIIISQLAS